MDLKEYEQEKFGIADIIRSAQAVDTKDEALQSECRDLLTRLAEDRFNLLGCRAIQPRQIDADERHPRWRSLANGDCPAHVRNHNGSVWKPQAGRAQLQRADLRREVPLSQLATM